MADSNIEWTDKVWNPVRGCERVEWSPVMKARAAKLIEDWREREAA